MSNKSQSKEMQDGKEEKRIPKCMSCEHELYFITQVQYDYIDWNWDKTTKRYEKINKDGDADAPIHDCHIEGCTCEHKNWEFLDDTSEADLGVAF